MSKSVEETATKEKDPAVVKKDRAMLQFEKRLRKHLRSIAFQAIEMIELAPGVVCAMESANSFKIFVSGQHWKIFGKAGDFKYTIDGSLRNQQIHIVQFNGAYKDVKTFTFRILASLEHYAWHFAPPLFKLEEDIKKSETEVDTPTVVAA